MTDHPDTITVAKCHPFRGDNFYITLPGSDRSGVEYIRADISAAHIADLTAKLAEREAQVARLLEMQTEAEVDHERQLAEARAVIRQIRQASLPVYGDKTDAKTVETIARLADDYLKGTP